MIVGLLRRLVGPDKFCLEAKFYLTIKDDRSPASSSMINANVLFEDEIKMLIKMKWCRISSKNIQIIPSKIDSFFNYLANFKQNIYAKSSELSILYHIQ